MAVQSLVEQLRLRARLDSTGIPFHTLGPGGVVALRVSKDTACEPQAHAQYPSSFRTCKAAGMT